MPTSRLLLLALVLGPLVAAEPPFTPRPLPALIAEAKAAQPPQWPRSRRVPDLVEVTSLDPEIRLAIGYASADNFVHFPIYGEAKAFLQRPAAEALARVNRALKPAGYALRVHDAYRPWWVTKVFWEATEPAKRAYVADPAKGSVHNRGCAVDVDLVTLDGQPVAMPSGYDEMTERSHAGYAGGSAETRAHRGLLCAAMAAEGFKVLPEEWWHFDYATAADYPNLNLPFEAIRPSSELAKAGQILLVTTPDWNSVQGSLQRFEQKAGQLSAVGKPFPVWIGKSGLAWRSDADASPAPGPGPHKREGDGRSPAGILTFGAMWGYAAQAPEGVRLPYRSSTDCDRCVDDANHADYGRIVQLASAGQPVTWNSAEKMRLDSEHYRYLVVIHYNDRAPIKGAGSCIFLHVAPPPYAGTAGCTSLAVEDLLALLRWLDPAQQPVLVQVPEPELELVRAAWSLPAGLRP
jgi:D-alanyl-D-alanine dipeptidase